MQKKAVLLINLGTPDTEKSHSVRRYLREFLSDPRVIDLPRMIRWTLVNLLIVPFRYKKTAAAYQKIWMKSGSPLLVISKKIQEMLTQELGKDYHVELAMRYGNPNIKNTLNKFSDYEEIILLPLFPQYSSAATGSALESALQLISQKWNVPKIKVINDFYNHPGFIKAFAEVIKNKIENRINNKTENKNIDCLVFSYHGLPERHINKSECKAECDHVNACPVVDINNRFCYRAQCYSTTESLVKELNLTRDQYVVSFQSRLGRTPWIKPYTDFLLPELIQKGYKNIAMVAPSFVADCLETLEEINIRTKQQWKNLGGNEFIFIPCVNDNSTWIKALADMVLM